jgi:predicted Zn-dependent peptidase
MPLPFALRRSLVLGVSLLLVRAPLAAQRTTMFYNGLAFAASAVPGASHAEIRLRVPAGIVDEPVYGPGVARLTAAILLEGSVARSKAAITKELALIGGTVLTDVDDDGTTLVLRVAPPHTQRAINMLADIARHPTFDVAGFEHVRAVESTRADSVRRSLDGRADAEFHWMLFPDQPLGRPTTSATTLEALKPGHLRNFHDDHYGPRGASLTITGPFDEKQLTDIARAARLEFSDWEAGDGRRGAVAPTRAYRSAIVLHEAGAPTTVRFGIPIGAISGDALTGLRDVDQYIATIGGDTTTHLVSRGGIWTWQALLSGADLDARALKLLTALDASRARPGASVLDPARLQTVVAGDSTRLPARFFELVAPRP